MQQGWEIHGTKEALTLRKGSKELKFDVKVSTSKGLLFCIRLNRNDEELGGTVGVKEIDEKTKTYMNINKLHELLGHMDEQRTRKTAATLGIGILRGKLKLCASCSVAKAKQKSVPEQSPTHERSTENNGRV